MVTHKTISNKSYLQPLFTTAVKVSALLLFSSMLSGCAGGDSVESPSRVNSTVTSNEKSAEDKVNQLTDVGGSVSQAPPVRIRKRVPKATERAKEEEEEILLEEAAKSATKKQRKAPRRGRGRERERERNSTRRSREKPHEEEELQRLLEVQPLLGAFEEKQKSYQLAHTPK